MFVATPTHRSLKNPKTGIDITVPTVLEVEAPLGGTTTEYEISVYTNLPSFKTKLHKDDDVVHFTVQKAYREVEDFYDKIAKRFSGLSLPSIPKGQSVRQCSSEEKRTSLDQLMKHISSTQQISHSALFQQFIGINVLKKQCLTSVALEAEQDIVSTTPFDTVANKSIDSDNLVQSSNESDPPSADNNISELFPKMKVRKSSQSNSIKEDMETVQSSLLQNEKVTATEELDLFEEVKQIKEVKNKETQLFSSYVKPYGSLFDSSEDDTNLFRVNSPVPEKNVSPTSNKQQPQNVKEVKKDDEMPISSDVKDSKEVFSFSSKEEKRKVPDSFTEKEILSAEKKNSGNIYLFEEQDFGSSITKEDEQLFYIPKSGSRKFNANPFLSPSSESTEENDIEESIEELTSLIEPSASLAPKHEEIKKVPKSDTRAAQEEKFSREPTKKSPVIAQRESFPKPPLPPKPSIATKPKPPAKKPAVPPRKKQDINPIDIMQYIEQEQKTSSAETSLFD